MRLLGPGFVDAFPGRILNVHPSLLPAFPGLHAQRQALAHGVRVSGGHGAPGGRAALDASPIVAQAAVPVLDTDTEDTLAARIQVEEHRLYPQAIAQVLSGRWKIAGRRFLVDERGSAQT